MRIGHGYDVHRLVDGRALILGGVTIPFSKGLQGHSDGDALTHAVIDAILGAMALGDIGQHFPDSDASIKGIDSMQMLAKVKTMMHDRAHKLINLDSTIICEQPKLSSHYEQIRRRLAVVLEADVSQISVKARTNEQLGFLGRSEAIAAQVVVLID